MHKSNAASHVFAIALFVVCSALPAAAQLRAQEVASGFARPLAVVPDPLVPHTLIVVQQNGLALAVVDGVTQAAPFLDLTSEVKADTTEEGLLGVVFAPDRQRVFVFFTKRRMPDTGIGDTVVRRYRRSASNPLVLDTSGPFDLVWPDNQRFILQPSPVHKGGTMLFGRDGLLYISFGDGGGGNHGFFNAQNPMALYGKMVRLDINVPDTHPRGYVVPPGNPFLGGHPIQALGEIWAFGYRNPWRFSIDDYGPGATGAIIVADVGQDSREEINYEPAGRSGRNYGWFMREGSIATPGVPPTLPAYVPLTGPLVDYPRDIGRSVTGGYVYRGAALPALYRGRYFLADYFGGIYSLGLAIDANGEARVADVLDHSVELGSPRQIPTFGRGLDGELYFTSFSTPGCSAPPPPAPNPCGRVLKIVPDTSSTPPAPPSGLTRSGVGSTVILSWQPGQGGGPVTGYQLEAGSLPGASNLVVTQTLSTTLTAVGVPNGLYYVRIRASNASALSEPSNELAVRVGCGGPPPVPTGLTAQVGPGSFAAVAWNAVTDAIGYLVEAGSATGLADLAVIRTTATGLAGIVPPATYFVRVRAVTPCETTPASGEIVVAVP